MRFLIQKGGTFGDGRFEVDNFFVFGLCLQIFFVGESHE